MIQLMKKPRNYCKKSKKIDPDNSKEKEDCIWAHILLKKITNKILKSTLIKFSLVTLQILNLSLFQLLEGFN